MYTIRQLIIDLIFVSAVLCTLNLQAGTHVKTDLSTIVSQEMCIDELFQLDANTYDQSVLRVSFEDNGVETKYEVVVTSTGEAYILKDNTFEVQPITYTSGDYFSASLKEGVFEIFQNSTSIYKRNITSTTAYQTSSAVVEDKLKPVVFDYIDGFCDDNGELKKCNAIGWGNTGFVSKNILKQADDGEIRWVVEDLNKVKMIGLGSYTTSKYYRDIDYAVYQSSNSFKVYESGGHKLTYSTALKIGDVIRIKKESGLIKYYLNEIQIYLSKTSVNKDLYVLGDYHSVDYKLDDIEASFTEEYELYTTATVTKRTDEIKWVNLKDYGYSSTYNGMVSTSRTPFALSENYYQASLEHDFISVKPNIDQLFDASNKGRDVDAIIGLTEFNSGMFLREDLSPSEILIGFNFVGKKDGSELIYIIENGRIIKEILNHSKGDQYKFKIDGNKVSIIKESDGKEQGFHAVEINPNSKHVFYQGAEFKDSPFIDVNIDGFSNETDFIKYTYKNDGDRKFLESYEFDIKKIVEETNQKEITHRIGWHNLSNIKGFNSLTTVREALYQEDVKQVAYGESAFRFDPTKSFKVSFIYSGGEYSIGSKPLYSSSLDPLLSGLHISGGQISLVNNGATSNTTSIQSGSLVELVFDGNGNMALELGGGQIGSSVQLPAYVLNLGLNLTQGNIPSAMTVSAITPPAAAATSSQVVNLAHDVFQENYNSDCSAPGDLQFRLVPTQQGLHQIKIYDYDASTTASIYQFPINVQSLNQTYVHQFPQNIEPGVYSYRIYYPNGVVESTYFSVGTTVEWNENNSNANNVDFIEQNYTSNPSLSFLIPTGAGAYSKSLNVVSNDQSFSQSFPVIVGVNDAYEMEVSGGSGLVSTTRIVSTSNSATIECYLNGSSTPYATFPVTQNGIVEQVFVMAAPGFYKVNWYYSDYGYRELIANTGVIPVSSSTVNLNIKWLQGSVLPLKGFLASYCSGPPTISGVVASSKLKLFECAPERKLWYYKSESESYDNPSQCPSYGVEFELQNLQPNTDYKVNSFQISGSVVLNYSEITSNQTNGQPYSLNYQFTTDANGKTTQPIVINAFVAQQIYDNSLKMELFNASTGQFNLYDFTITDPNSGITENLSNCYNYRAIYYDCFYDEEGSMEVKRNSEEYPLVPNYEWSDNSLNESAFNGELETGCYTVSLDYDLVCGLPDVGLPYKIAAKTIWADLGTNTEQISSTPTYTQPEQYIENTGGAVTYAKSLNALDYTLNGLIWYRNVYDNTQSGSFGYFHAATNTYYGIIISQNTNPSTGYTHTLRVYIENTNGSGYYTVLNNTPIDLNQFEFIEFIKENANGTDETGGVNLKVNIYPEFSTSNGVVTPRNSYTFPVSGLGSQSSYQLFASPSANSKLGEFGLNFCPPPVEKYFALMSRNLHDGRHELKTCIDKDGYTQCPIEIKNDCGLISELHLLKFKFDEVYYRSLSPSETLDFEIRDYQNNIVLSSADNLPNTIVKLGDNRYQLSMNTLNSTHPYYTLIVKNAKNEKRYLRFKK